MIKKEIVKRAIKFCKPERLPISFPSQNEDDIYSLSYNETDNQKLCTGKDEWGCVWRSIDKTMGNVFIHPLDDWDKLKNYPIPNPHTSNRFDDAKKLLNSGKINDCYIMGGSNFTLFERMHFLRGFNELLKDIYLNQKNFLFLANIITDFQIEIIKGWAELKVDGITFCDDWGTQSGLIINPQDWRKIFKPFYKKLFSAVHKYDIDVFFHSDGQIFSIIPDLIDCGVSALEIPQPNLLGIEKISKNFLGTIAFYGSVDKQTTMVYGSLKEIEAEVKLLLKSLATEDGGFIAREPGGGWFSDYEVLDIDPNKVSFIKDLFKNESKNIYK